MAGYSAKPLLDKLGIKKGQTVYFKNAPEEYFKALGDLPEGVFKAKKLNRPVDFMHCFYTKAADLKDDVLSFQQYLELGGMLWVSWPRSRSSKSKQDSLQESKDFEGSLHGKTKKTGKVKTDITEQTLRDVLLPINLVDIKVAAIDGTWSGLKFVWRKH